MARRNDETVAVEPLGIVGVIAQKPGKKDICNVCHPQRHARMARIGCLNCIQRERSDCIRAGAVKVAICCTCCHVLIYLRWTYEVIYCEDRSMNSNSFDYSAHFIPYWLISERFLVRRIWFGSCLLY